MRRYRTVIIIALLGIIPMIAGVFAMRFVLPDRQPEQVQAAAPAKPAVEKPELRLVLAAARDLPVGTLLGDEDWKELGIEVGLVRRGHITVLDPEGTGMPYGYVVREPIAGDSPLTWQSLVGPKQRGFLAAVLRPGMRAITVRLSAGTRHSGLIDPGDRVDVVLTADTRKGGPDNVLSRTILEDVRVLAVDRRIGSAAGEVGGGGEVKRTEIVTATLEVLPTQTGLLALGEYEGELALAVRPLAAAGHRADAGEIVELNSLLSQPEQVRAQPEAAPQKTVRVIRGTSVTGESFEIDAERAAFNNASAQTGP